MRPGSAMLVVLLTVHALGRAAGQQANHSISARGTSGLISGLAQFKRQWAHQKLARLLSLLTVVRFHNGPCVTPHGVAGTCYHRLECASRGGAAGGHCARGFGVCCYFVRTCGQQSDQNCTYFVNPGFPAAYVNGQPSECVLTINKRSPKVTQLRLDFKIFELEAPRNGTCTVDQFTVSGQNRNSIIPVLCGNNTGNHIYMDVDSSNGPFQLSVSQGGGNFPRRFKIKVTQLRPGDRLESPRNCLQYYVGVRGSFHSFNYEGPNAGYLNNLNYAICIRKEAGYCSITYTNEDVFQLVNVDEDGDPTVPPGQAGAGAVSCTDDYIIVTGLGLRLCGDRLNDASVNIDFTQDAPVTDTSNGPFIVGVRTNNEVTGRGFHLMYRQNICGMT
ncbi:uncharacterized protein LOC126154588 [Schistocerca cancellata]|uniref:uncharacterized protein LOC126154588 n=1 Tax=Schistocerca cancellata TaxID=274614 RepID=UPI0021183608|nr:uncharacterized protein LOC126154588 [Schistocerca cancellata]